jgi:hypothetical protein
MSLILTAIGLNTAVVTNFITFDRSSFHAVYKKKLDLINILAQLDR